MDKVEPSEAEWEEFMHEVNGRIGFALEGVLYKEDRNGTVRVGLYLDTGLLYLIMSAAPLNVIYDWFTYELEKAR